MKKWWFLVFAAALAPFPADAGRSRKALLCPPCTGDYVLVGKWMNLVEMEVGRAPCDTLPTVVDVFGLWPASSIYGRADGFEVPAVESPPHPAECPVVPPPAEVQQ